MWRSVLWFFEKLQKEGSFIRNVSIVSSWNVVGIIAQFALSPIITRIYTPAEYGVYALFNSIVINLSLISSLKYAEAIILADNENQRNNIILLVFCLTTAFSFITLGGIFIFKEGLGAFFNTTTNNNFLYLIPAGVYLTTALEILININIRKKLFFRNGLSGFLNSISARSFNIFYGIVFLPKAIGLIMGDLFGKILAILSILFSFKNPRYSLQFFLRSVNKKAIVSITRQYKSFPLYFLPSSLLIYLSGHLPLYFFQAKFGLTTVGAYALASSMLEIINRLIPYALSPVFLQKANELKNISLSHLSESVYKLFLYMLLLGTIIFAGFALVGETIFPLVFGKEWLKSGAFVAVLAIPYAFNFVAVSLSEVYNVIGRQRFLLANSIVNVVLKVIAIVTIMYLDVSELSALFIYSLVSSVGGMLFIVGVFSILNYRLWRVSSLLFISLFVLVFALTLGNFLRA